MIPGIENKVKTINNFIDVERIGSLAKEPVNHPWLQDDYTVPVIIGAGRLSNQKNWPLLLKAFSKTLKERKLCCYFLVALYMAMLVVDTKYSVRNILNSYKCKRLVDTYKL